MQFHGTEIFYYYFGLQKKSTSFNSLLIQLQNICPNTKIHKNKPRWRGCIIGLQSRPTTPCHTQQQYRIFIYTADPPSGMVLHEVADGQEGDAVNRSLVYDLPTQVKAHLITRVEEDASLVYNPTPLHPATYNSNDVFL